MLNSDKGNDEKDQTANTEKDVNLETIHVDNILPENVEEININDNKVASDLKLVDETITNNNEDLVTDKEEIEQLVSIDN